MFLHPLLYIYPLKLETTQWSLCQLFFKKRGVLQDTFPPKNLNLLLKSGQNYCYMKELKRATIQCG